MDANIPWKQIKPSQTLYSKHSFIVTLFWPGLSGAAISTCLVDHFFIIPHRSEMFYIISQ